MPDSDVEINLQAALAEEKAVWQGRHAHQAETVSGRFNPLSTEMGAGNGSICMCVSRACNGFMFVIMESIRCHESFDCAVVAMMITVALFFFFS